MSLKDHERELVGRTPEESGLRLRPAADIFDAYVRDDEGVRYVAKKMETLGIDLSPVRKRINFHLHPSRIQSQSSGREENLDPSNIVYKHLHEYVATLLKCLELVEHTRTNIALFHKDPNLKEKAIDFVHSKIASGSPVALRRGLEELSDDLFCLRGIEIPVNIESST